MTAAVLTINAGSSSLKFSVYRVGERERPELSARGQIEGIGTSPHFTVEGAGDQVLVDQRWPDERTFDHLRQTAGPSRDKPSRLVRASDLFELGISLMETCEDRPDRPAYVVTRYRDGLLIAILTASPMRLKNLANLVIGQHLVFDGSGYWLKLSATETKTGRPYVAPVAAELTPYIDGWLQVHRPRLQLIARGDGQVDSLGAHRWRPRAAMSGRGFQIARGTTSLSRTPDVR